MRTREIDEVLEKLKAPLDPKKVKVRRVGGGEAAYLPGNVVFETANEIFGPGEWGYTILEGPTLHTIPNKDGEIVAAFYSAKIELRVYDWKPIQEVGSCPVNMNSNNPADEHDKAFKGALTDAVKRGLRGYGNPFGLSLYDKDDPLGDDSGRKIIGNGKASEPTRNGQARTNGAAQPAQPAKPAKPQPDGFRTLTRDEFAAVSFYSKAFGDASSDGREAVIAVWNEVKNDKAVPEDVRENIIKKEYVSVMNSLKPAGPVAAK